MLGPNYSSGDRLAILVEEVGEVAHELTYDQGGPGVGDGRRDELVKGAHPGRRDGRASWIEVTSRAARDDRPGHLPASPRRLEQYQARMVMTPEAARALDEQVRLCTRASAPRGNTDFGIIPGAGGRKSLLASPARRGSSCSGSGSDAPFTLRLHRLRESTRTARSRESPTAATVTKQLYEGRIADRHHLRRLRRIRRRAEVLQARRRAGPSGTRPRPGSAAGQRRTGA